MGEIFLDEIFPREGNFIEGNFRGGRGGFRGGVFLEPLSGIVYIC